MTCSKTEGYLFKYLHRAKGAIKTKPKITRGKPSTITPLKTYYLPIPQSNRLQITLINPANYSSGNKTAKTAKKAAEKPKALKP